MPKPRQLISTAERLRWARLVFETLVFVGTDAQTNAVIQIKPDKLWTGKEQVGDKGIIQEVVVKAYAPEAGTTRHLELTNWRVPNYDMRNK